MSDDQDLIQRLQIIRQRNRQSESDSSDEHCSLKFGLSSSVMGKLPHSGMPVNENKGSSIKPSASATEDNSKENSETCIIDCNGQPVAKKGTPRTRSCIPRDLFYINDKTGNLQIFKTFDELSEYLVEASVNRKFKSNEDCTIDDDVISTVMSIPLGSMNHYITIGQYLRHLYDKDKLMDVQIDVGNETFKAHRIALSCVSPYFAKLLNSGQFTKFPINFRIKGTSEQSFAAFLEFVYTGEVSVSPSFAVDFLGMAEKFSVSGLQKTYGRIIAGLPLDCIVQILAKNKDNPVLVHAMRRAEESFMALINIDGILDINIELVCNLLKSDQLNVCTEFTVFEFAIRYISHKLEDRLKYASKIISLVRFTCMTQNELFRCSEITGLVRGYEKFREQLLIANWVVSADALSRKDYLEYERHTSRDSYSGTTKQFSQTDTTSNHDITLEGISMPQPLMTSSPKPKTPDPKPRTHTPTPPIATPKQIVSKPVTLSEDLQVLTDSVPQTVDILVIGGFQVESSGSKDRFVDRYSSEENQWVYYCNLQQPRRYHAVVTLNGKLYVLGGSDPNDETEPSRSVYSVDLKTKEWTQEADMNDPRQQHCACVSDGFIYVLGGKGEKERVLETVERYDPDTETWDYAASLELPVYAASAAILNDQIYIVGGITQAKKPISKLDISSCVARYDPSCNSWEFLNDMRFPRCRAEMVNVGDRLFLCGGAIFANNRYSSRFISLSSIDEYMEKHDMWCHLTDLVFPRHDIGIAVAGHKLYIVGGESSSADRVLQSIECFDTQHGTWLSGVQDLPRPTRWLKCATVESEPHNTSRTSQSSFSYN